MKFAGFDLHSDTTVVCVIDEAGEELRRAVVPTTKAGLRSALRGIRRPIRATIEEGTLTAWAREVLRPRVSEVTVCNPRYNALIRSGTKNDRIDAAKLAELLRLGALRAVYHDPDTEGLRLLLRHYNSVLIDTMRVMFRIKAALRRQGLRPIGMRVYRSKKLWLGRVKGEARFRLAALYDQLALLQYQRDDACARLVARAAQDPTFELLQTVPAVGPIRAAYLLALIRTPWRFSSRSRLWAYAGLAVVAKSSADHGFRGDTLVVLAKPRTCGLNRNGHPLLKQVLKDIALANTRRTGALRSYYNALVRRGIAPRVARVALARKIAVIVLSMWRRQVPFSSRQVSGLRGRRREHHAASSPRIRA